MQIWKGNLDICENQNKIDDIDIRFPYIHI
jgi:hypothetical protein